MNEQEGRTSSHEEGARQPDRTTEHTTTARAFAHGTTVSDALAWTVFTLVVGVVLIVACVLLTLGWPS